MIARVYRLFAVLTLLTLLLVPPWAEAVQGSCTQPPKPSTLRQATIVRVVDGDTLVVSLDGAQERVRLIGIDTPEVHQSPKLNRDSQRSGQDKATILALGKQASAFTKQQLQGKTMGLELDVQPRDRYGRLLAYVWVDGTLFNRQIVREGFAAAATYPPNVRYAELLAACQREARAQQRGRWGR